MSELSDRIFTAAQSAEQQGESYFADLMTEASVAIDGLTECVEHFARQVVLVNEIQRLRKVRDAHQLDRVLRHVNSEWIHMVPPQYRYLLEGEPSATEYSAPQ